jgi:hypothetical protein
MAVNFGRVVVDERGIRQRPFLMFFGPRFDLKWAEVTGWALAEGEYRSNEVGAVTVRVLELHTPGGMHSIQRVGTDPDFGRLVEAVAHRLPGRKTASVLARTRPNKFR